MAEYAITSDKSVTWGEEEFTVTESWVSLGELLLRLVCDPMRVDNSDRLPAHIAQMNGNLRLSDVLTKVGTHLDDRGNNGNTKVYLLLPYKGT